MYNADTKNHLRDSDGAREAYLSILSLAEFLDGNQRKSCLLDCSLTSMLDFFLAYGSRSHDLSQEGLRAAQLGLENVETGAVRQRYELDVAAFQARLGHMEDADSKRRRILRDIRAQVREADEGQRDVPSRFGFLIRRLVIALWEQRRPADALDVLQEALAWDIFGVDDEEWVRSSLGTLTSFVRTKTARGR